MKILVGCEEFGKVRQAFRNCGHDAWSCDILPAADNSPYHIQDDVTNVLHLKWDMAILFPPCTRLCLSGVRWLHVPPLGKTLEQIWQELEEGAALFSDCWNCGIPRLCVENPIMHPYAIERIHNYQKPQQFVHSYWFGYPEFKSTGLHLRGLPLIKPTKMLWPPKTGTDEHKKWSKVHRASPGPNCGRLRGETNQGLANAMAEQWGLNSA
jgi:hypothetical protein